MGVGNEVNDLKAWYGSNRTLQDVTLHIQARVRLIEFDSTRKIFTNPSGRRTVDYITGRFG